MTRSPRTVAILGYGKIARDAHGPAWQLAEGAGTATVVKVFESTATGCAAAARAFPNATIVKDDARQAFVDGAPAEVVDVCTPGVLHHELVTGALNLGCHVMVEKPLAHSDAEVADIMERQGGASVQVCQTFRLATPVQRCLDAIRAGRIGTISRLQVLHHARHILSEAEWVTRSRADGLIFENAVHFLDLVHYILGAEVPLTVEIARFQQTPHRPVLTGFEFLAHDEHDRMVSVDFRQDSLAHSALNSWAYLCGSGSDAELRFYPDGFRCLSGVIDPVHDILSGVARAAGLLRRLVPIARVPSAHAFLVADLLDSITNQRETFCPPRSVRSAIALGEVLSGQWHETLLAR
jgi:predicted dehydrogenase